MLVERLLTALILVATAGMVYSNIILMVPFIALIAIILIKTPYFGPRANARPTANHSITIVIQVVYLAANMTSRTSIFNIYGPLIILILVLACIVYSIVAIVSEFKESI